MLIAVDGSNSEEQDTDTKLVQSLVTNDDFRNGQKSDSEGTITDNNFERFTEQQNFHDDVDYYDDDTGETFELFLLSQETALVKTLLQTFT